MRIETLEDIPAMIREVSRFLKEGPGDHYVLLVYGSQADDGAALDRTELGAQIGECLAGTDEPDALPGFLKRMGTRVPQLPSPKARPKLAIIPSPDKPDDAA